VKYVALLRGINVGGNHIIKMVDLKACFEGQGLKEVATYIQSGNVVFSAGGKPADIARRLETAVHTTFDCRTKVVLRSEKEMAAIVARAPRGFGTKPDKYRYDVIFLNAPLTAADAITKVPMREGVDQAHAGAGVLYFSRLVSKATQSKLGRVVALPIYKEMTIRNWRTTTTLLRMMTTAASGA
jgi:uncharacterized protein (DUF1697 family)